MAFPSSPSNNQTYISPQGVTYSFTNGAWVVLAGVAPVASVAGKTGVVTLTSADVGLSNVDNTLDVNKPVSTATQTALNLKQNTLTAGTNISIVGSTISSTGGGGSSSTYTISAQVQLATSATPTGGAFVSPTSVASGVNGIIVKNSGAVILEYQRNGAGDVYPVLPYEEHIIVGITDPNQIGFRRADYATARTTQITTLSLKLILTSETFSVTHTSISTPTNGTYAAFPSFACSAMIAKNASGQQLKYKINAGTGISILERNGFVRITGITNANQVSFTGSNGNGSWLVSAETFQAVPVLTMNFVPDVSVIKDNTRIYVQNIDGQLDTAITEAFATPAMFAPFTKWKKKKKVISMFDTVANMVTSGTTNLNTGGDTLVDATLTGDQTFGTYTTAPQYTWSVSQASVKLGTLNNTPTPIDCSTGGSIHFTVQLMAGSYVAFSGTGVRVRLYSSGTPTSPAADFHQADLTNADVGGYSRSNGYGNFSVAVSRFAVTGAGCNLAAVTYALFYVKAPTNAKVQPSEISYVKNASNGKASIVFTFDDDYLDPLVNGLKYMAPYGYPGVLFPSANGKHAGTSGLLTLDQRLALQNKFGWQIAGQDFYYESTVDMTSPEWITEQQKNIIFGVAQGFDGDGIRDFSWYGGASYPINTSNYKVLPRFAASARQFYNGSGTPALVTPIITGGAITGFTINTAGNMYTSATVRITGDGTGASATVTVSAGAITGFTGIVGGSGYTTATAYIDGVFNVPARYFPETNPPGDPMILASLNMNTFGSDLRQADGVLTYFKNHIDQAVAASGICIFSSHNDWLVNSSLWSVVLPQLMAYIRTLEVAGTAQVVTLLELRKQSQLVT